VSTEAFLAGWVERLRHQILGAVAVILKGSYAGGAAGLRSDIDVDVLVEGAPIAHPYLTWIEPDDSGRLVHVSVAVEPVDDWLQGMAEPASWSFGLPAEEATHLLWCGSDALRARLDRPSQVHPAGDPELEDTFECLGKARDAAERGDDLGMRLHLHDLALLVPSLLVAINPPVLPGTRPEALAAVLALPVVPEGFREDMLACLGLNGEATTPDDVLAAGTRLVMGTLALLERHADTVCPLQPPYLGELLSNRTLRRYLDQGNPVPGSQVLKEGLLE
jgi:phosphoribosyl-AMP cyclohydrolase